MNSKNFKSIEKIRKIENNEDKKLVCETLSRIFRTIVENPIDISKRKLLLESDEISGKLLPIDGGLDLLFEIGFVEDDDGFTLPNNIKSDSLKPLIEQLDSILNTKNTSFCSSFPKPIPYKNKINRKNNQTFAQKLTSKLDFIQIHESELLKQKALAIIPIEKLNIDSKSKYDSYIKLNLNNDQNLAFDLKDFLLLELLAWFKIEFFHWINKPDCEFCSENEKIQFLSSDTGNEIELAWMAYNVEVYLCLSCGRKTRFPRYNHPEKLLQTRGGRCGEWANCFYLCLRALDFDARYILDWTDHVWCEVWSESQNRWLHADPCENALDKPLIYEHGWKKELSYIVAFSRYECVDVTFRYSSKHVNVMKRRNECDEDWLAQYTWRLSQKRQISLSQMERKKIEMRRVGEIVEFLAPKVVKEGEDLGRQSGSLQWRLERGEIHPNQNKAVGFEFKINPEDLNDENKCVINYNPVRDSFQYGKNRKEIKGWKNTAFGYSNMQLKIEHDWKMCYLARTEKSDQAFIEWMFKVENLNNQLIVDKIELKFFTACYENGKIDLSIKINEENIILDKQTSISTKSLKCKYVESNQTFEIKPVDVGKILSSIKLRADLMNGIGDCSWQHTQLFRTKLNNSNDDSLYQLTFHFK